MSNKRLTADEELEVLNMTPAEDQVLESQILARRHSDPNGAWQPLADDQDLAIVQSVQEQLAKKHEHEGRRRGRPKRVTAIEGIFMKWPKPLLAELRREAEALNIPYQHFIRMLVTERMEQRKKERS